MPELLIVTDADWIADEVDAALGGDDTEVDRLHAGAEVLAAVAGWTPDLVVLDLQSGNMGGFATCMDLRLEEGAGRLPRIPVLMLLDRDADVFLARRCDADGWMVKPLDAFRLRKAAQALLDDGSYHEGVTGIADLALP
ncbi:response regulator [soil metagenome]